MLKVGPERKYADRARQDSATKRAWVALIKVFNHVMAIGGRVFNDKFLA